MRYWYDTEFLEDGRTIELISIGIVAEDGREYYAENLDADYDRINRHQWLADNVVPQLDLKQYGTPKYWIAQEVQLFLAPLAEISTPEGPRIHVRGGPELWAWYGAYDHIALAQLFGTMLDLPDFVPMWTNDLRQEQHRLGNPVLPKQPAGLHNALADARHLKVQHDFLRTVYP
ncbi:3'-5' exoribonuclease domain-containing protein [Rhodococcoides fascians]|uniref:3'-5' exoribonuclease domain-containing protein n=1 Tax=Rhodococcoides fascians TaxID=1828 RepID=UPI00050BF6CE|nr:3'-5' exoribonuclease [Rhodococcus fascians]